ncbi:hypothetical protein Clacol_004458 [Clathrus columnatus]|uniref:Tse2 ADP-ribosyltransferase toxin domain-containing protein n=1 Tax=Clathrus columnatus TaxID=1419009 RepID=A0AAV5A6J8_9AGAM|nr:hypothetical protein Clacol_004458 [Clathrus columnatus]
MASALFTSFRSTLPLSHSRSFLPFSRNFHATSSCFTQKPSRPLIARYKDKVPVDLARVQSGRHVKLRDYENQVKIKRFSYDLKLKDGKVYPAKGDYFIGPNGCSLREPLSPTFQEVVRNFRGANILVFVIPKDTPLPPTLTILHEHSDHFSIQCTSPMTLEGE